ncbi:unnamed protein product [Oikopleura dioica]|uniref:DNA/RNA-binding protein Kin17 WH-like domain-containing protein n=1 Tax=Oikopleura dioica TaxID=34765 RepID=E4YB40_OIKDI|nr:unnamed protein product [Oikopleura dioica]
MPKAERGTPKDIANRQKAKGLQKLRWYCQMCEKQCRDENGFKCHIMSESHQRQLLLCAQNPNQFQDKFSKTFLDDFLYLLKRRWGTKRVWNNTVYNEYIMDRDHIHMNATKWLTLSEFTEWLGKEGYAECDYQDGKGWFLAYIDRDPQTLARKKEIDKMMRKQDREEDEQNFKIDMLIKEGKMKEAREEAYLKEQRSRMEAQGDAFIAPVVKKCKFGEEKKTTQIASIEIKSNQKLKVLAKPVRWVQVGAVVKVKSNSIAEFHKQKGFVKEVNGFRAVVQHLKIPKMKVQFHEDHLETVIPQVGREVVIMKGDLAKKTGVLKEIRQKEFCVLVEVKLTEDETTEAFFKFDEVSKKHEKKKKVEELAKVVPIESVINS